MAAKGIEFEYFYIVGKGIWAYISNFSKLKKKIKEFCPDIIHAHYGLSGFFANWQRRVPVVTTYHGGDVNYDRSRPFSRLAIKLSAYNIFVSEKLMLKARAKAKYMIQPCGLDLSIFHPVDKEKARKKMGLDPQRRYILFSSSFSNPIKNARLAKEAIALSGSGNHLIELMDYSRREVMLLLNACDVALLTSFSEGSPQFIKEAMACNCPIVTTNVGSVEEIIDHTEGCYISSFNANDVSDKINHALREGKRTNGSEKVAHFDNEIIANRIIAVYKELLSDTNVKEFPA
jgi:glycosyltransferase involved in cell wall biosynthesis